MILLIDNYDSFTYNLYQLMCRLGAEVEVVRNDAIDLAAIEAMAPTGIVISPGPGTPDSAGISLELVSAFSGRLPILGVCLGHQCIGQAYGATVVSAPELMHGKSSMVYHDGKGMFTGVESPMAAIRYHSLTLDPATVPASLCVTARTENGVIMGLRHNQHDVEGVQFHPESVMTPEGPRLIQNWLERVHLSSEDLQTVHMAQSR